MRQYTEHRPDANYLIVLKPLVYIQWGIVKNAIVTT